MTAEGIESRLVPAGAVDSSAPVHQNGANHSRSGIVPVAVPPNPAEKKKLYRLALNRLRCVMISLVLLYHATQHLCLGGFFEEIIPGITKIWMSYISAYVGGTGWPMFVFFTLGGYAAFHSLRVRSIRDFVEDRSLRLIPPLIFGLLLLHPLDLYVFSFLSDDDNISGATYTNFFDFYERFYLACWGRDETVCAHLGTVIGTFWYLLYLYILCILCLPIFLLWKRYPAPDVTTPTGKSLTILGFIALPFLVWASDIIWKYIADVPGIDVFSAYNFFSFLLYMLFGYFLAWCKEAHEVLLDSTWFFLGVSIALMPLFVILDFALISPSIVQYLLIDVYAGVTMYAVWGLGHMALPYLSKAPAMFFDYIADRAIAIYVLHMLILHLVELALIYLVAGTYLDWETMSRLLLHFSLAYIFILATYEGMFRYKYTKVLVGMLRVSDVRAVENADRPGPAKKPTDSDKMTERPSAIHTAKPAENGKPSEKSSEKAAAEKPSEKSE